MKVVFSHDWLNGMRGGEKCLESLATLYPDHVIRTLFLEREKISPFLSQSPIETSLLQNVPGVFSHYKWFLPVFPAAVSAMGKRECDLVISTNHCVAKAIPKPADVPHICYCFTPMRYAWLFFDEYFGRHSAPVKTAIRAVLARLRDWDVETAANVTDFVAISEHVADRIRRFYKRDAAVIYPPVDTEFYTQGEEKREDFYLLVSALVPYKRADLAVEACRKLGVRLVVVGSGPEAERLRTIAGPNTEFLGWQSNEKIRELYRTCKALIFPGEEDFGIVPLEVQACGAPVVAYAVGGALETVTAGKTGVFFKEQNVESLIAALETTGRTHWNAQDIRANAERFNEPRFRAEIDAFVRSRMESKVSA